jgi:nitrogen fixation protein NifX
MTYRIAVASSDGKVVNSHFGRATQFLIFDYTALDDTMVYRETRENNPGCSNLIAPTGAMKDTIELISDCHYVLVSMIGPSMVESLHNRGIIALIIKNFIPEALEEWKQLQHPLWNQSENSINVAKRY